MRVKFENLPEFSLYPPCGSKNRWKENGKTLAEKQFKTGLGFGISFP
jgi:hypothetical protein